MRKPSAKMIVSLIVGLIVHQYPTSYGQLEAAFAMFERINGIHDTYLKFKTASTDDLMDAAAELSGKIDEMGNTLAKLQQTMDFLLKRLPLEVKINSDVQMMNFHIERIDTLFSYFEGYIDEPELHDEKEVDKLMKIYTALTGDGVMGTVGHLSGLIAPGRLSNLKQSLFELLAIAAMDNVLMLCSTGGSPQKRLLDLFNVIVETETRASLMTAFGYTMDAYIKNKSASANLQLAEKKLRKRGDKYLIALKKSLQIAPTQFRECDPVDGHKLDVTALVFGKFLQGYITSESALTHQHSCDKSCESHSFPTAPHLEQCSSGRCGADWCQGFCYYSSPLLCRGDLISCESMRSAEICQYGGEHMRRYRYFKDNEGNTNGDDTNGCDGAIVDARLVKGTRRGPFGGTGACAVCKCICSADNKDSSATRFISCRERVADVNNNMVIVGLSFMIKDRVAHIGVMQGELGPRGFIDEDTVSWIEPENIQVRDVGGRVKFYKVTEGKSDEEMRWNTDVSPMDVSYRRLSLDRLTLPNDYVLTGVKFARSINNRNDPIQLEIQGTRFDYDTGKLTPDDSMWIKPETNDNPRKYTVKEPIFKVPTGVPTSSQIDTKPNTYIDMYWSDWLDDAAQTTLPLLDAVPVHGLPHMPLMGVGLYHKRQEGYGGFLTFVLDELNRAYYLTEYEEIKG